jgi:hypothetical protein
LKLAKPKPDSAGRERAERLRRDGMAAQPLRTAYPAVQYLRLELQFSGMGPITPALQAHVLHPPARAFFQFPCPYADCGGAFNLTSAVNVAMGDSRGHAAGTLECSGLRSVSLSAKQPCKLQVMYKVDATFHPK